MDQRFGNVPKMLLLFLPVNFVSVNHEKTLF